MHVITIEKTFSYQGALYKGSHKYVCSEFIENDIRATIPGVLGISYDAALFYKPYTGQDLFNKKLLIMRSNGLGDMLMLEPTIRALKNKYPSCDITAASGCKDMLLHHPCITELLSMPYDFEYMEKADYHIWYQGILEGNSNDAKTIPAVNLFAKASYIDLDEDKMVPRVFIAQDEPDWIATEKNILGLKSYTVMMQLESSCITRNFPAAKFKILVDRMAKEDIKILLVGNTDSQKQFGAFYQGQAKNVSVLSKYTPRQIILIASVCDQIFAPDSFLIQAAGALNKDVVGVYNCFPSRLRMSYFKNAIGLDCMVVCSPCFSYSSCFHGYPPPCFQQIEPDDVMAALDYLRFKRTGTHYNFFDTLKPNPRSQICS